MVRMLHIACLLGCLAVATTDAAAGQPVFEVPPGERPTVDGTLSHGEWAGARKEALSGGGELLVMGDARHLYLGIRAGARGVGSVCLARPDGIAILHASAALGTATYERSAEGWKRTREFSWHCRDTSQSPEAKEARLRHLGQEHWVASNGNMGTPEEFEYVIEMPEGSLTLAVAYLQPPDYDSVAWWPPGLEDDCRNLDLVRGDAPETMSFSPGTWAFLASAAGPPRGRAKAGDLFIRRGGESLYEHAARIDGKADVGGRKLRYRVYGTGDPPVVLVSGFGAPQVVWDPIIPALAARTTVVTYDRAGYGESELGSRPVDGMETARDLHTLLEKAGIPGPYILVGHSYGGDIVRLFASMYPKEMAGLVLEETQHEEILEAHRSLMKGKELEEFNRMLSMQPPGLTGGPKAESEARETTRRQLRESGQLPRIPLTVLTAGRRPPWSMFSEETAARMAEVGVEYQKKLVGLIPGGKLIPVEDAGHNLHHDKPEVVIRAISEMIDNARGTGE